MKSGIELEPAAPFLPHASQHRLVAFARIWVPMSKDALSSLRWGAIRRALRFVAREPKEGTRLRENLPHLTHSKLLGDHLKEGKKCVNRYRQVLSNQYFTFIPCIMNTLQISVLE